MEVAVGVAFGRVAVCDPDPTEMKAMLGPSFTTRSVFPALGSAAEELAVDVTVIGSVLDWAENGFRPCMAKYSQSEGISLGKWSP